MQQAGMLLQREEDHSETRKNFSQDLRKVILAGIAMPGRRGHSPFQEILYPA